MSDRNWRWPYPPYPPPEQQQSMPADEPLVRAIRDAITQEMMKRFYKPEEKKEDKKDDKKVLGLSEKDIKWILLLTAPLTGFLMSKFYVTLLTSWPHLPN